MRLKHDLSVRWIAAQYRYKTQTRGVWRALFARQFNFPPTSMNFALYLTPHNVESITIIVMVFGLIIGWLTERSVQAATHNAINAVLLIPSVMLAVYRSTSLP